MEIEFQTIKVGSYYVTKRRGWVVELMPKMVLAKDGTWKLEPEDPDDEFDSETRFETLDDAISSAMKLSMEGESAKLEHPDLSQNEKDFLSSELEEDDDDGKDSSKSKSQCLVCKYDNPNHLITFNLGVSIPMHEQYHIGDEPTPKTNLLTPLTLCKSCLSDFLKDFTATLGSSEGERELYKMCQLLEDVFKGDKQILDLDDGDIRNIIDTISIIHSDILNWAEDQIAESESEN